MSLSFRVRTLPNGQTNICVELAWRCTRKHFLTVVLAWNSPRLQSNVLCFYVLNRKKKMSTSIFMFSKNIASKTFSPKTLPTGSPSIYAEREWKCIQTLFPIVLWACASLRRLSKCKNVTAVRFSVDKINFF